MNKLIILLISPFLIFIQKGISQSFSEELSTTFKVKELISLIDRMYVEKVDEMKLELDFIAGMHNRLSPFKAYQKDNIIIDSLVPHQDKLQGIGIAFAFKGDSLLVKEVIPNSGADKAGIKEGDRIIKVGDHEINDFYYYIDVARALTGKNKSSVEITTVRDTVTNNLKVDRIPVEGYSYYVLGEKDNKNSINDFETALHYFDMVYADSVENKRIVEFGISYMLEQLDPHSAYISIEDLHEMNAPLQGSFTGVGVRFQIVKDTIIVVQAIPGGPSEKVGIQAGDQFVYIDGENVGGIGIKNSGVRDRLLGEKGSEVKVKMKRKGSADLIDFTIERDKIPIYSLDASYIAAPGIGYIKLNNFSATTVDEVKKAVTELKADGMKDLIIDLQSNGGGYLMTAINLADEMLSDDKLVVYTEGRSYPRQNYDSRKKGSLEEGRIIILVNESSASASEIVSGAIQDWDRGLIVGRRSFGKGLVQKPIYLSDGSQVRITTQRYYTPVGRCIQKSYDAGSLEYRKEKYDRYLSGESFHKDSIHFNDSLKYETKLKHRSVYGGGGIMPDIFVPLDTTGTSDYYSKLVRKGVLNQFSLSWVNENRDKLESKYPTFSKFKEDFKIDKVVKEMFDYAEKEGIEYDEAGYKEAENTINIRLTANIAQNLYDYKKFYEVINDLNTSLQKAIELLETGKEFDQILKNE